MGAKGTITDWEWTTLVAAWRYYEHGHNISSALFPSEIIDRFWGRGNRYTDDDRRRIALQFATVDHGLRGEEDWTIWQKGRNGEYDSDCAAWTTFYKFCKGAV